MFLFLLDHYSLDLAVARTQKAGKKIERETEKIVNLAWHESSIHSYRKHLTCRYVHYCTVDHRSEAIKMLKQATSNPAFNRDELFFVAMNFILSVLHHFPRPFLN